MPTREIRDSDSTILVEWCAPLSSRELSTSFYHVAQQIGESEHPIDVLIDISTAGHIPVEAPMMAIRSGFLGDTHTRNVVIIGSTQWAQILARIASRTTGKPIIFFRSYDEAAQALTWVDARAG